MWTQPPASGLTWSWVYGWGHSGPAFQEGERWCDRVAVPGVGLSSRLSLSASPTVVCGDPRGSS